MKKEYTIKLSQSFPLNRVVADVSIRVWSEKRLDFDHCVISDEFYPEINTIAKAFFNPGYYDVEVYDRDGELVESEVKMN